MREFKSKAEMLEAMRDAHGAMNKFLEPLTPEQMVAPELNDGWSVKDSLAHIAEWQTMLMGWINQSRRGETVKRFIPGFTFDTPAEREPMLHRLNAYLFEQSKPRPLTDVRADLNTAHEKMLALVSDLSEDEIYTPGHFAWCGSNPLYGWIEGDAWEHYTEHMGWIQEWLDRSKESASDTPQSV